MDEKLRFGTGAAMAKIRDVPLEASWKQVAFAGRPLDDQALVTGFVLEPNVLITFNVQNNIDFI
jgi:hypothetical protein